MGRRQDVEREGWYLLSMSVSMSEAPAWMDSGLEVPLVGRTSAVSGPLWRRDMEVQIGSSRYYCTE